MKKLTNIFPGGKRPKKKPYLREYINNIKSRINILWYYFIARMLSIGLNSKVIKFVIIAYLMFILFKLKIIDIPPIYLDSESPEPSSTNPNLNTENSIPPSARPDTMSIHRMLNPVNPTPPSAQPSVEQSNILSGPSQATNTNNVPDVNNNINPKPFKMTVLEWKAHRYKGDGFIYDGNNLIIEKPANFVGFVSDDLKSPSSKAYIKNMSNALNYLNKHRLSTKTELSELDRDAHRFLAKFWEHHQNMAISNYNTKPIRDVLEKWNR